MSRYDLTHRLGISRTNRQTLPRDANDPIYLSGFRADGKGLFDAECFFVSGRSPLGQGEMNWLSLR